MRFRFYFTEVVVWRVEVVEWLKCRGGGGFIHGSSDGVPKVKKVQEGRA